MLPPLRRVLAIEFLYTAVILCVVITIVRWLVGPSPVLTVSLQQALIVVGVAVGLLLWGMIESPWGRASGAHVNPAISVGLWLLGEFPGRRVLPYAAAQLAGSLTGTALAGAVWGTAASGPPVAYAAIRPAPGWGGVVVYLVEAGGLAAYVVVMAVLLSRPQWTRWLPVTISAMTAVIIATMGPRAGGSVNPAREFGPALLSGFHSDQWAYFIAPLVGAAVAGAVLRTVRLAHRPRRG